MQRAAPRATRLIAWALMVAFAVVVSATCASADDLTPEQMACCATMGHDCGALGVEMGCCAPEPQTPERVQASGVKHDVIAAPALITGPLALIPPYTPPSVARGHHPWSLDGSSHAPPAVPRYLLVSSLLI